MVATLRHIFAIINNQQFQVENYLANKSKIGIFMSSKLDFLPSWKQVGFEYSHKHTQFRWINKTNVDRRLMRPYFLKE